MTGVYLGFLACSVMGIMMYLDRCYKMAMLDAFGAGMCFLPIAAQFLYFILGNI